MELPVNYDATPFGERRLVREEYVKRQGGNCHHCKQPLNGPPGSEVSGKYVHKPLFPSGFFKWPVHLHHCHRTGMTIGAVHNYCNAVLWQYLGE